MSYRATPFKDQVNTSATLRDLAEMIAQIMSDIREMKETQTAHTELMNDIIDILEDVGDEVDAPPGFQKPESEEDIDHLVRPQPR